MHCTQCGAIIEEGNSFCGECGRPVPTQMSPEPAAIQGAPSGNQAGPDNDAKKIRLALIIAIAAVLIAAIAAVAVFFMHKNYQDAHAPHTVRITVNAPGRAAGDTLIPVQVNGNDLDGTAVDELVFVDPNDALLSLKKGSYELSFPASPLTEDGILYSVPGETIAIEVSKELESGAEVDAREAAIADFKKLTALDESEETINAAYEYAIQEPSQVEVADALKEKATQVHADAVAQEKAAAEKAARIDHLTGKFGGTGAQSPAEQRLGAMTIADDEVIINGNLIRIDEGSFGASMGSDEWVFELTDDTVYGFVAEYLHQTFKEQFAQETAGGRFVSVVIELDNGVVKKIYTSP